MRIRILSTLITLLTTIVCLSQGTGSIAGKLTDQDYNNEPLPFANIVIKGTTTGTTSDIDGLYIFENLEPGAYTVVYSFVGYETQEITVDVVSGKVTTVNVPMGASSASLDEVVITTTTRKESEAALLLDQKKAVEIKESIGAIELAKLGVSNASAATTKIAGVSKSEGSGQIYVRGLGDRYLTTKVNGLPIPSDNIDKKNINLELFPTRFISNVAISKTFSPYNSTDQASGNINITTKNITSRKDFGISLSNGLNTNAVFVTDNFVTTALNDNLSFGIFSRPYDNSNLVDGLTDQGWNTVGIENPINYSFGFNAGGFLDEKGKFRISFSGGQSVDNEYREGLFRFFDRGLSGSLLPITGGARDFVPEGDNRYWQRTVNTNGLLVGQYKINQNNELKFNAFAINKVLEEVYEGGRGGEAIFFDELTPNSIAGNQFVRDQNIKNTFLSTAQLIGDHELSAKNKLDWAIGYNRLAADEPNRIRNELNFRNVDGVPNDERPIELGNTGGFQQRKSSQEILDQEFNGRIKDDLSLKIDEDDNDIYKLSFGGDGRYKQRDFRSTFVGLEEGGSIGSFNPVSIDDLSSAFTQENVDNGNLLINVQPDDFYDAELTSYAGFVDFVGVFGNLSAELGLRYQSDRIFVDYNVNNAPGGREGETELTYNNIYPSFNLKYDLNEKMALRLSGSLSQTLPEFKEIAPFEYVSPEGLIEAGNRLIERSTNTNLDLKYEFFPSSDELISVTAYYKNINDAINRSLRVGGGDVFSFYNTGDARIFGIELEGKVYVIKKRDSLPNLKLSGNVSYIDHKQDLKDVSEGLNVNGSPRTFQYGGNTAIGLEGASDWTTNLALTLDTGNKYPFEFTLAGNYASDRIYAIGSPIFQGEDPNNPGTNLEDFNFNGEIIERGFIVLDFILNKSINEHISVGLNGRNLLNPEIERFQNVASDFGNSSATQEETILSYKRGVNFSLNISYKF
ncbi:TonB-dependent receptor [Winogradskyella forsetii]|uniref:TonB-dependent receptor n=1 Tax=Winogradskyella forsetii TaxID=2686077 RepID=UPI0015BE5A71|nr:TonB-dependent receptor [Winogradskyella forsetii]